MRLAIIYAICIAIAAIVTAVILYTVIKPGPMGIAVFDEYLGVITWPPHYELVNYYKIINMLEQSLISIGPKNAGVKLLIITNPLIRPMRDDDIKFLESHRSSYLTMIALYVPSNLRFYYNDTLLLYCILKERPDLTFRLFRLLKNMTLKDALNKLNVTANVTSCRVRFERQFQKLQAELNVVLTSSFVRTQMTPFYVNNPLNYVIACVDRRCVDVLNPPSLRLLVENLRRHEFLYG